jgi:hypothetical protein
MKKLFSLLFLLSCIGFANAQAQGLYVYGQVADDNDNPIANAIGYIEYSDCDTIQLDTLYTDSQGVYEYLLIAGCTQGSIYVTFYCPNSGAASTGQGSYFPNSPEIEINLTLNCGTVIGDPCSVSFYQGDSLGIPILDAYVTGGVAPYDYEWSVNGNGAGSAQYLDMGNYPDGTYNVCVSVYGADGNTCEYCYDVIIDASNSECWTGFGVTDTINSTYILEAWAQGTSGSYTYEWLISSPVLTVTYTGNTVDLSDLDDGTYFVCVIATGGDGDLCEYCEDITIGTPASCNVSFYDVDTLGYTQLQAYITGNTASYQYEWLLNGSVIGSGDELDIANFADGTYYFCVVAYGADGSVCEYCASITIGNGNGGDECLDWNVIDLANAPCNMDYNPVCGCDGIEYTNACIAYYCFGVLEWTDGPCNYTGGDNGNTNGNPLDSLCETTAEFFYYGDMNAAGEFDVFFFGFGVDADEYSWDMGDGSYYAGDIVEHTYSVDDSIQAYTICLTTWALQDSCTATICETIVLDDTPNGYIGGEVVEGDGIGGSDGEVERLSGTAGDPLSEVTVELQDPTGAIIATTTTDAQGKYSFSGLQFGDYFVHVNIDGVSHSPDHITLNPVVQDYNNISYEVTGEQVVLGIDGVSFASGIGMSPNPTSGNINISLILHESADINIVVTDVLGKTVRQMNNNYSQGNQSVRLDLEGLSSGIYMVSLQSNGEVYTEKILKK